MSETATTTGVPGWDLRHRMARALEWSGVTTEEMGDEIGRGERTVRNYLSGATNPSRAVLVVWAARCGVPLDWLAEGIEPPLRSKCSSFLWARERESVPA